MFLLFAYRACAQYKNIYVINTKTRVNAGGILSVRITYTRSHSDYHRHCCRAGIILPVPCATSLLCRAWPWHLRYVFLHHSVELLRIHLPLMKLEALKNLFLLLSYCRYSVFRIWSFLRSGRKGRKVRKVKINAEGAIFKCPLRPSSPLCLSYTAIRPKSYKNDIKEKLIKKDGATVS